MTSRTPSETGHEWNYLLISLHQLGGGSSHPAHTPSTHTHAHRKTTTKNVENCLSKMWPGRGSGAAVGFGVNVRHTHTHKHTQAHYINLHAFIAAQRERNKQTNKQLVHRHTYSLIKDLHTHTHTYTYQSMVALCNH